MLGPILKKEACAECRFCCAFRRKSLWETPIFTGENLEAIRSNPKLSAEVLISVNTDAVADLKGGQRSESEEYFRYDLSGQYKTDDSEEEAPCPYLSEKGCILSSEEKPWDCKIWPLRVMKKDGETVIALTPTCPEINKLEIQKVKSFVEEELKEALFSYAEAHPYLMKEYHEGFPVLAVKLKQD